MSRPPAPLRAVEPRQEARDGIVATLRALLAKAEAGHVRSVYVVHIDDERYTRSEWAGDWCHSEGVGAAVVLQDTLMRSWREQ